MKTKWNLEQILAEAHRVEGEHEHNRRKYRHDMSTTGCMLVPAGLVVELLGGGLAMEPLEAKRLREEIARLRASLRDHKQHVCPAPVNGTVTRKERAVIEAAREGTTSGDYIARYDDVEGWLPEMQPLSKAILALHEAGETGSHKSATSLTWGYRCEGPGCLYEIEGISMDKHYEGCPECGHINDGPHDHTKPKGPTFGEPGVITIDPMKKGTDGYFSDGEREHVGTGKQHTVRVGDCVRIDKRVGPFVLTHTDYTADETMNIARMDTSWRCDCGGLFNLAYPTWNEYICPCGNTLHFA